MLSSEDKRLCELIVLCTACSAVAWMAARGTLLRTYAGTLYLLVSAVNHRAFSREWLPAVCAVCALDLCLSQMPPPP